MSVGNLEKIDLFAHVAAIPIPRISHQTIAQEHLLSRTPEDLDTNWNLNDFFGHVYVINLDDNPNGKDSTQFSRRLARITADLDKIGRCVFERVRATYGAVELDRRVWDRIDDNSFHLTNSEELDRQHRGQAGCFMSHYRVIQDANAKHLQAQVELADALALLDKAVGQDERKIVQIAIEQAKAKITEYSSILILEDDNGFGFLNKHDEKTPAEVQMTGAGVLFRKVMSELDDDWDMLYLVSVECGKDGKNWARAPSPSFSENLNRLKYGLLTNAIAINSKAYSVILRALSKIDDEKMRLRPVDHEYAQLQASLNVFTPKKPLAYQAAGESSITNFGIEEPWNGTWFAERKFR